MSATMTSDRAGQVTVRGVRARAYTIPTDAPEADGTLEWDATTIVVVHVAAGDARGIGWTYGHASLARLIEDTLAPLVVGADALAPQALWAAMARALRNVGRAGAGAMALAALDSALWDLKARLLGLPLCELLGAVRDEVPLYGSGGFTSYPEERLRRQLGGWAADGFRRVKLKVGADAEADPRRVRVAREAVGPDVELFADANGAYSRRQALRLAEVFADECDVRWFEEPVSSEDRDGLRWLRDRVPSQVAIAAGEYVWTLADARALLDAGAVDVLQADVSRCGGITELLRIDALCRGAQLGLSLHCAPALHAHVALALSQLAHLEWFHDHVRIEAQLFDGALEPRDGVLRPDRSRPGNGLELRAADAERWSA
jgi:L-alanine-DL-glutamate epimerase-like enolase superfamily enzyme